MDAELTGRSFAEFVNDAATELSRLAKSQGTSKRVNLQDGKVLDLARMSGVEYAFRIESEVYLPDGVEVTWLGEGRKVQGSVVFRSGDYIEIWFDSEIGGDLSSEVVYVGVPDFLDILSTRLKERTMSPSPLARKLMAARSNRSSNTITWQKEASDHASEILKRDLVLVWGPPGTGKTYTLSEVACRLVRSGKRVLMISNTNVAVDQAVVETAKNLRNGSKVLVRFGVSKDRRIINNQNLSSYEMALSQERDLRERRNRLLEERKTANPSRKRLINEELSSIRSEVRKVERRIVSTADFVATTTAKASMESVIFGDSFDTVLFDEAGMALIPQIAFAACLAKNRVVCFGDFRQLPPIVKNNVAPKLEMDVYEWLGITSAVDQGKGHKLLVSMGVQHRSHPAIAEFVGEHLYSGRLATAQNSVMRNYAIAMAEPLSGSPMVLIDTTGFPTRSIVEPKESKSYSHYNVFHAILSVQIALLAKQGCTERIDDEDGVAIITPYAAQAKLIRSILRSLSCKTEGIRCSTVHGFQGSSSQIVVFDTVDAHNRGYSLGHPLSDVEHRKADRLINVALTRARGKVIVVADLGSMNRSLKNENGLLLKTLLQSVPAIVSSVDIETLILREDVGMEYIRDGESLFSMLKDINTSISSVLLNIPCMREDKMYLNVFTLGNALHQAAQRGVKITVRGDTELIENVPKERLEYVDEIEYAFHPLCIVDERVVWYGPYPFGGQTKKGTPSQRNACWRIESREVATFLSYRVGAKIK